MIGDYKYSSQKYFERFIRLNLINLFEKIEIDFNQYKGYNMGPNLIEVPYDNEDPNLPSTNADI